MNNDGVPAAPHVQPNPTPDPYCAFSGPRVAELGLNQVGWKNATTVQRTLPWHSSIRVHGSECGRSADPKLAMADFTT
ncbi:MAG: hypothetical protein OSA23_15800 [Rhodospirillales bacterium]|nr:hypothetical protein [Rhodospirillales bacterium]